MEYEQILSLITKLNNADNKSIKNNLHELIKGSGHDAKYIADMLNVSKDQLKNNSNQANPCKLSFEFVLKVCVFFQVTIDDLIKPNNRVINTSKRTIRWNDDVKQAFIKDVEEMGVEECAKLYSLSKSTVNSYYEWFKSGIW